MTVAQLGEEMSSSELVGWGQYLALEAEEAKRRRSPEDAE